MPPLSIFRKVAVAVVIIVSILLAFHWSPTRQVTLHQRHFLEAVESRNWPKASDAVPFLSCRWGETRTTALERLPQAFQDFLACGILEIPPVETEWKPGRVCVVRARLRFVGSGGPVAQFLMNEVAELKNPFAFAWQRKSWKPWDWQLESVEQPEIEIPAQAAVATP